MVVVGILKSHIFKFAFVGNIFLDKGLQAQLLVDLWNYFVEWGSVEDE